MKNTIKVFGIIAFVAVIGFSMAACEEEGGAPSFDGVWKGGKSDNIPNDNVTVTISGDSITVDYTSSYKGPSQVSATLYPAEETFHGWMRGFTLGSNSAGDVHLTSDRTELDFSVFDNDGIGIGNESIKGMKKDN